MTEQQAQQETGLQDISDRLESCFNKIYHERMSDVPVINDRIEVSAINFQPWQDSYLGVLITPWFMNLILFPGESENWDDRQELTSTSYNFPSGKYSFLMAYEPDIGKYQSCSLFSPMFEFADNDAAIETAEIVLRELMNSENIEQGDIQSEQIEKIWNGEEQEEEDEGKDEDESGQTQETAEPPLSEKMNKPMSRRKLLRKSLMMDDDVNERNHE